MSIYQNLKYFPLRRWGDDEIDTALTLALAHLISNIETNGAVVIPMTKYDRVIRVLGGETKNIQGNFEFSRHDDNIVLRLTKLEANDDLMEEQND